VVAVRSTIDLRIDWLDAPRVSSPDLAATWAACQLWIGDECVTHVETIDGDDRRSVFGSLYPLAEWIADNWWSLTSDLRPSALPSTVCGLAVPRRSIGTQRRSGNSLRFSCARALGIGLNDPSGGDFILSPVGTHFHRVSRAFAAELLAPAEGISGFLAGGLATEEEIEDLADHSEVSSRVIEHQCENQLC
jgi:hypothetical protein